MLVAAGQPVEVTRTIRDVAGDPFDPASLPVCVATHAGQPGVSATVRSLGEGTYAARVPGAMLSTLGTVELAWSWEFEGDTYTATDHVDVTTVPVATVDDILSLPGASARAEEPMPVLLAGLSAATVWFETECGETFSPRLRTERVVSAETNAVRLTGPSPAEVIAVEIDGAPGDPTTVRIDRDLNVATVQGAILGRSITVTYRHGMDRPPDDVTRAVSILATSLIADGPFDDRGVSLQTEHGFERLLTAGVGRAKFSVPEVEAAYRRHRRVVIA
jgi:hypothetical protein